MTKLRALAEAADPREAWYGETFWQSLIDLDDSQLLTDPESSYIAAASPSVILALLDMYEAADTVMRTQSNPASIYNPIVSKTAMVRLTEALARAAAVMGDEA